MARSQHASVGKNSVPGKSVCSSAFRPAWWLRGAHAQTLWGTFFHQAAAVPQHWERLQLPDKDFIDLVWTKPTAGPLVLVLHGLGGSLDSHYAAGMLATLSDHGYQPVLMHFRGCSKTPNRLARSYHAGETGDLAYVVHTLRSLYPDKPLHAIGYSLGGNVLLKWLGETGKENPLHSAVAVSVPFSMANTAERLNHGLSRLYRYHLLRKLKAGLARKFTAQQAPFDLQQAMASTTFRAFDEQVTAPLHGFSDADSYYHQTSCRPFLADITVPTLILHAKDDPFMTPAVIPSVEELSDQVCLELSTHGGHVGFITGFLPWRPVYWVEQRSLRFFKSSLMSDAQHGTS